MKWQKMVSILSRLPVSTVILQPMQTIKVICFSYGRFRNLQSLCISSLAESSKKQLSRHSVHTTVSSPSVETTSVAMTLEPTTVTQSSGLVTRYETKKGNLTKSTFSTPKLPSPRTATSHWLSRQDSTKLHSTSEPMRHTLEPGGWKITSSYYLDQVSSSWNDDGLSERRTSTESGFVTRLVSSLNIIRSPVLQNASYMSYLSTKKMSTGIVTTTAQDIETLVSGVTSSGSTNVWSSISTAVIHLSHFEYSKSAGVTIDLQMTQKERDRSKLGPTSSSAVTYRWDTSEAVDLPIEGTDMTDSRLSPITKSSQSFPLPYKLSDATNVVNSLKGSLPGNKFSIEWMFSQSISPILHSTMVSKETSSVMKSSFSDNSRIAWSMPVFHTPAVGSSILESVSSFIKVHGTRQSVLPGKLTSTESKLVSSGSSRADFTPVLTTPLPSLSLFTNQGSSAVEKVLAPTEAITQKINSSMLGPRGTKQVVLRTEKHSLSISTSPRYTRHYGISTSRDLIPFLKNTSSLLSLQQIRPSISQPQYGIKATSFDSAVILKSNSDTKSSSLGSSPDELNSLPVDMVSSYGSVSSDSSYDNLPTFASEATTHGFSAMIASQKIVSFIPTSNSKSALASGKMSTQQWHSAPSADSLQHRNPKSSVKESLPTNLTAQTTKLKHTFQQTSQKGTSTELALTTITSSLITRGLSLRRSTTLSQGLQSIAQFLPTGQLITSRISSHSENTRLSTVSLSMEHLKSKIRYETSQHQSRYTTKSIISTIIGFSITTVMSNTTAGPSSRTRISQLDNAGFSSNISSILRPSSRKSLKASPSSKKAYFISSMKRNNTLVNRPSDTPENTTGSQNSTAKMSQSIQSTRLSPNKSSASRIIPLGSSNLSLYGYNATHSQYAFTMTVTIFPSSTYTSKTQVKPLNTTDSSSSSTVLTNTRPGSKSTAQVKFMDGSLVIRNGQFHANLSNPNTTMFKNLADEVKEIIMDIVSSEAEVTSFRNGSIIANFYLVVAYDTPFSDRDYAEMLSEANQTQWRGYQVANITVTLRSYSRRSAARLQDGGGLSKAAVAAIFTVFFVLLIAVGCFGVYICKKKGLCERSRVKPAE